AFRTGEERRAGRCRASERQRGGAAEIARVVVAELRAIAVDAQHEGAAFRSEAVHHDGDHLPLGEGDRDARLQDDRWIDISVAKLADAAVAHVEHGVERRSDGVDDVGARARRRVEDGRFWGRRAAAAAGVATAAAGRAQYRRRVDAAQLWTDLRHG